MNELKILEVSAEVAPFARTGGLGDVLGALPKALARTGHEVKVMMPGYGSIDLDRPGFQSLNWSARITLGDKEVAARAHRWRDHRAKVEYYFIGNDGFFDREHMYLDPETGKDYEDNVERFTFFNLAVLELVKHLDWHPEIIHVHDWHAAIVPAYLKTRYANEPGFQRAKSVITIHNLGHQGVIEGEQFPILGLPDEYNYAVTGAYEFYDQINFLKGGIVTADAVTTVSPTYAEEICSSKEFGAGLEGVLSNRKDSVHGILNGVDYAVWSPSRDKHIPFRYNRNNLTGKRMTRVELLNNAALPIRDKSLVIGVVSRLADQKGWDLIEAAADKLFAMNVQMIVLGTGDQKYHVLLEKLEEKYPDQVKAFLTFDDKLAHWIEAGADAFLMPSMYEPCGLNQMYSLRYGTVPIVRKVGGLADTVIDYDHVTKTGTGFVFEEYTPAAMLEAISRAVELFQGRRAWTRLMKNGIAMDFSWNQSALLYAELFESLTARF
jgi:starch synthase